MSDGEIDAELLALADDDSASEAENKSSSDAAVKSKSPTPDSAANAPQNSRASALKGIARPKQGDAARAPTSKRHQSKDESDEEGEASSAGSPQSSLGSGAMSESDSDAVNAKDDGVLFPVDGIFRSDKEKAQINAMPEIERERLLAERAEEAEKLAQSAKLRQLMQAREKAAEKSSTTQKKRKAASDELEESPRKSSRAKTKQSENLAAYKRQREQRNEQRKLGSTRKSRDRKSSSPQDPDLSDAKGDAESDVEWDDGGTKAPTTRDESPPTLHDFERVRVGRSNFAKVCYHPGFEDKIKGCFVRVSIGINKTTGQNTYRMTQIKGFVTGKPYLMEGDNAIPFYTDQYAILAHGKSEKEWPFIACSDSKFTDAELSRYLSALSTEGLRAPLKPFLVTKCEDIHKLLDHRWSEEQISTKIRRKTEAAAAAKANERERLEKQKKIALANNNEAEVERLDNEIAIVNGEKPRPKPSPNGATAGNDPSKPAAAKGLSQQERLAAINRANRKANIEEIRKAQIEEKRRAAEAQRAAAARGEVFSDPFARVKTRAKVHHDANSGETLAARRKDDLFGEGSDLSRAGTPGTGTSRAGTPVPGAVPATSAPKIVAARKVEKTGTGGVTKARMDDDVLGAMDLGIEIDI